MLIILHGEDTFRSRQKLNELQKSYLEKNKDNFNLEKFDATEMDFRELKSVLNAQSLFVQKRFIVVENILENKTLLKNLQPTTYNLQPNNNIIIFYERADATKDKDYKKILKQADKTQEFKKLTANEATNYFSKLFERVDRASIQKVLNLCQQDFRQGVNSDTMWQVYNELGKLYSYKNHKAIKQEDIEILNIGQQEAQIFPTIDAIFSGNANSAFYNMLLHFKAGEHPQIVFNMIEMQLKNIALVKEAGEKGNVNAGALGLHPYVVKKASALADKFSWDKIKNLYERVENLDVKNKTGQISTELATELLAAAIVK